LNRSAEALRHPKALNAELKLDGRAIARHHTTLPTPALSGLNWLGGIGLIFERSVLNCDGIISSLFAVLGSQLERLE
jgi:hypothetical protein